MSYDLLTEKLDGVLWVAATGTRSLHTLLAISKEILSAWTDKEVKKVLIDVQGLEDHLNTMEAYEIPSKHFPNMRYPSVITQVAVVDLKAFENSNRFFENVAVNRGFNLRIFSATEEVKSPLKKVYPTAHMNSTMVVGSASGHLIAEGYLSIPNVGIRLNCAMTAISFEIAHFPVSLCKS